MKYMVKSVERNGVLSRDGGVAKYESIAEASRAGVMAGDTFVVVDESRKEVLAGLRSECGFVFVEIAERPGASEVPWFKGIQQAKQAAL